MARMRARFHYYQPERPAMSARLVLHLCKSMDILQARIRAFAKANPDGLVSYAKLGVDLADGESHIFRITGSSAAQGLSPDEIIHE